MGRADAYLDIETTGLSPYQDEITVIGVGLAAGPGMEVLQLIEGRLTRRALREALRGASSLFTYNGRRFDLPFIRVRLGIDLEAEIEHHDLMDDCWSLGLYGGFKAVEQRLGIPRATAGMSGSDAVHLWWQYRRQDDSRALARLLAYNREDVANLQLLRERLAGLRSRP